MSGHPMYSTGEADAPPPESEAAQSKEAPVGSEVKSDPGEGRVYRYGVTDPISWGTPSPRDYQLTEALEETLTRRCLYETVEGSKHREFVLQKLNELVQEWVSEVGIGAGLSPEDLKEAGGKIFTFGSYRLGVVTPTSDIDTLCVAPHYVTREAFFTYLFAKLQQVECLYLPSAVWLQALYSSNIDLYACSSSRMASLVILTRSLRIPM
eukprot:Protomagalhaensia_sp_Gyna_25__515@NODE_1241_length_2032_cov_23_468138_g990_i0_p2_GENE_NODE_1241_length_2032_cov_23_468138_g990_i0NODE_1241_length_2032_cov_23_468138_g990_i0_p2_ORF_typecomplete_len209_score23_62PAP_central/PF04928_17/2_3e22NTP_transf_2/PF01909_23/7_6e12Polbeta/PF18765_1/6_5e03Polbeta/PF18765_1/0_049Polbeta/PF18765_1/6_2e03_NODE_1241_length_2032_cov_23_468138_g990_i026652